MYNTTTAYILPGMTLGTDNTDSRLSADEQQRARPRIDDIVCQYLDGEKLKDALFIIDNILEHKMKIKWSSVNVWSVQYKRKHVCDLRIENDSLRIGKVSDILATRVKKMSYDPENMNRFIDVLKESIVGTQEINYALQ